MRYTFLLFLLAALFLGACQASMEIAPDGSLQTQTAEAASLPTLTPPPSPTPEEPLPVSGSATLTSSGDPAVSPEASTTTVSTVDTPTRTPAPALASTASPTMNPASLEADCHTPMSLMLHSAFGAERMAALADEIENQNLNTITYRQLYEILSSGSCPDGNDILVSIDDLGSNWLRYDFIDMIRVFTERSLVLTVGVVTKGPQNEANWEYFRELESLGIEIASHSMNHYDLSIITDEALQEEVAGSYDIICENMGTCPQTLIVPFGRLDEEGRVLAAADMYNMLISIQGGLEISGKPPYLLGRIPPDNDDQARTIALLEGTFGSTD